jgi:hypothetical protein
MTDFINTRSWQDERTALDVWRHFGSTGGGDKDQMIKIVTWLLSLSTGIVSLYATGQVRESRALVLLFAMGVLVSLLAAFTALLYGAYAAWNWAIADRIAVANGWVAQSPRFRPIPNPSGDWNALALKLAKPCEDKVAPVFWLFFFISTASLAAHAALLVVSIVGP